MDNSVLARTVGGTVAFAVELGVAVSGADWWALSWRAGVDGPERGDSRQLAMAAGQAMQTTARLLGDRLTVSNLFCPNCVNDVIFCVNNIRILKKIRMHHLVFYAVDWPAKHRLTCL